MGAVERQRPRVRIRVGQLEDHCTAREPGDHLPAPLHAGHAHHLRRLDVVVPGAEVVDELVVALPRLHAASLARGGAGGDRGGGLPSTVASACTKRPVVSNVIEVMTAASRRIRRFNAGTAAGDAG